MFNICRAWTLPISLIRQHGGGRLSPLLICEKHCRKLGEAFAARLITIDIVLWTMLAPSWRRTIKYWDYGCNNYPASHVRIFIEQEAKNTNSSESIFRRTLPRSAICKKLAIGAASSTAKCEE